MKNTGKYLEAITTSIEKSLIDNSNTIIKRNISLTDRDDVDREIDIYVETVTNNKKLKYAIECKQLSGSSRVEIADVSDFHSKIANQGAKGIMITTTGYRKNAIKKANNLNIDVYKIVENPNPIIKSFKLIHQRHQIIQAQIHSSHFEEFDKPNLKYIYMGKNKKRYTYKGFLKGYLGGEAEKMININRAKLFNTFIETTENGITWKIRKKEPHTFFGLLHLVYFKQDNKFYPIEKWQVNMKFWIDYFEEENPNSFQYIDMTNQTKIANFFAKSIEINTGVKGYLNIIELSEGDEIKIDYVTDNPKEQKNIKSHDFGTFAPGEMEFGIKESED